MQPTVLLVEDDTGIGRFIDRGLRASGYGVDWVPRGGLALDRVRRQPFDMIILDLALPDMDGLDICRGLRADGVDLPILILSARDTPDQRVAGLDAGSDDYLTKPFHFQELLARLRALHRRHGSAIPRSTTVLDAGSLTLEPSAHRAALNGREVTFSPREYALLLTLVHQRNRVVSRRSLLDVVWGEEADVSENAVDVYVGYLRRKLDEPGAPRIETVRGVGFRLDLPRPCA